MFNPSLVHSYLSFSFSRHKNPSASFLCLFILSLQSLTTHTRCNLGSCPKYKTYKVFLKKKIIIILFGQRATNTTSSSLMPPPMTILLPLRSTVVVSLPTAHGPALPSTVFICPHSSLATTLLTLLQLSVAGEGFSNTVIVTTHPQ
jgi:hypothetical protein